MKFYLKINNEWVQPEFDADNSVEQMQLNWTFDNLENPLDYVGEYSYDFVLPFTRANREMFKYYEQMDSAVTDNTFHPNVLIPYIIHTTNDVISTGEAYLSEINESGYVMNLNGSLCTAFTKLLNSGWNTTKAANNENYYLFNDITETLDKNLIYRMWMNDTPDWDLDESFSDVTNVLTAVPMHQGLYSDFDSKSNLSSMWLLPNIYFKQDVVRDDNGNAVDMGDGLNEWQVQEYRSYEQNFAIYIQKLFAIYQAKCKDICDYDLELDNRWFNQTYEYLENIVYVLGRLKHESPVLEPVYGDGVTRNFVLPSRYSSPTFRIPGLPNVKMTTTLSNIAMKQGEILGFQFDYQYTVPPFDTDDNNYVLANWGNPLIVELKFTDENNVLYRSYKYAFFALPDFLLSGSDSYYISDSVADGILTDGTPYYIIRYTAKKVSDHVPLKIVMDANARFMANSDMTLTPEITIHYHNDNAPFCVMVNTGMNYQFMEYYPLDGDITTTMNLNNGYTITPAIRSKQVFTFEKAFGDIDPFTVLIKYCKLFGFVWIIDDYTKTIKIKRRSDYFYDLLNTDNNLKSPTDDKFQGFTDVTEYTDFDSFKIVPMAWTTRRVELNYDKSDEKYTKKYYDKYGRTYGSVRIFTENYLNNDTEEILCTSDYNTISPSCTAEPYYKPYSYYKLRRDGMVRCLNEPTGMDDSGKQVDIKNNFYFRLSNRTLPYYMHLDGYRTDDNGSYAYISDDSEYEIVNNVYCWHSNTFSFSHDQVVRKIPSFSTIRNGYSLQLAAPYELYFNVPIPLRTIQQQPADLAIRYVYEQEFEKYIEEIYNVNNKTLEVYVVVDGKLYRKIKTVPLVIIGDVAYLVTEIEGWNEFQPKTKLKLRQILNYDKLIYNNHSGSYTPETTYNTIDGTIPEIVPLDIQVNIEDQDTVAYEISDIQQPDDFGPQIMMMSME